MELKDKKTNDGPNSLTALELLMVLGPWQTKEGKKVGPASNSELRRWIANSVLHINGEVCNKWDEKIDFPVFSIVLWPKNEKQRTTLW